MSNVVILGDLHLGDGKVGADDFGPDDSRKAARLRRLCAEWKENGDDVIANGDIGEFWQFSEQEVLRAHGDTIDALREVLTAYVRGNHDRKATRDFLGLEPLPYLVHKGTRHGGQVWIEHGDAHDWWVARYPALCETVTRAAGWAERIVHPDSDRWAAALWHRLTRTGRHGGNNRYLGPVAVQAIGHGCERAVFNHTHVWMGPTMHRIGIRRRLGVEICNSGCWTGEHEDLVIL